MDKSPLVRPTALNLLRLLWLTVPLSVGPTVEHALAEGSDPVRWVATTGLWAAWAAVLLAVLVPRAVSLTVLRAGCPALLFVAVAAALRGGVQPGDLLAVATAAVVLVVAVWPSVGADLVDGSSYGPERRLPLRVPPAIALGPAPVAVVLLTVGTATGPLLLAARQWIAGAIITAIGVVLAVPAARALHSLSRRFVVFVPGGVVVHDPLTLVDPVLLPRSALAAVGPAPAGTDAADLTIGAGGLVMELRLDQPSELLARRPGRSGSEPVRTAAVLVAPTRPGAFMDEVRSRHLPTPAPGA